MKKSLYYFVLLVSAIASSCSKDTQPILSSLTNEYVQKAIVASGTWKVTYFIDGGKDLTSDFDTYLFQFENDGSAAVNSSGIGILYSGMWNVLKGINPLPESISYHRGELYNNSLRINVHGNYHMDGISGLWKIGKLTLSEIWLTIGDSNSGKEIHLVMN